jgi:hypothetical protein
LVHFCLLPAALAHVANTSVRGLHYVLIFVSYNEILFSMYLCKQHLCLSCERLRMARLDDCSILQLRHLVENRLGGMHDSISVQNLRSHSFACTSSQTMSRATKENLAWRDLRETRVSRGTRYPSNLGRSRSSNVWLGEPRLKCRAIMTLRTNHTWEKP